MLIGADLATSVPNIYAVGDCAACRDGSLRTSSLKVADLEKMCIRDRYRTFGELSAEMHSPEPSVDKVLELDSRFHTQIANAAQNPMLATITEYITRLTMPSRLETTRKVLAKGEEEIERFVELHRQLDVYKRQLERWNMGCCIRKLLR